MQIDGTISNYSGYIVVSAISSDSTGGPGRVSLFSPNGTFVRSLYEFVSNSDYVSGLGFIGPNQLFAMIEGQFEDVEIFNLDTRVRSKVYGDNLTLSAGPIRQIAVSTLDRSIYIAEDSTENIEKLALNSSGIYARVGSPFISQNVGSCALLSPWGIVYIPTTNQIAVGNAGGGSGIAIYNSDGTCARFIGGAPFNNNSPIGIAFHTPSNKLIVGFSNGGAIYSINLDGTGSTLIFNDSSIINAIRTIATDSSGNIYVGSATRDTIEKLYYSGSGSASRILGAPLIGPLATTANATQIVVIP